MANRNVPNPNHKPWTHISNVPIPILLRLIQRKSSKQNFPVKDSDIHKSPQVKKKWTAEDYKNYEDWQARSAAIDETFQKPIKNIDKKSKKAQALRDEKWQEALEELENGSKKQRAEATKKLDRLIDEIWDTL
jgi:hypothetical protein